MKSGAGLGMLTFSQDRLVATAMLKILKNC
jgi:hypothetical protein